MVRGYIMIRKYVGGYKSVVIITGPCKVRNETETKRNETKRIETKRNRSKRNETDRNETKQIETKRNKSKRNGTKRNETNRNETKQIIWPAIGDKNRYFLILFFFILEIHILILGNSFSNIRK